MCKRGTQGNGSCQAGKSQWWTQLPCGGTGPSVLPCQVLLSCPSCFSKGQSRHLHFSLFLDPSSAPPRIPSFQPVQGIALPFPAPVSRFLLTVAPLFPGVPHPPLAGGHSQNSGVLCLCWVQAGGRIRFRCVWKSLESHWHVQS